jgi:hypothetical protein
MALGPLTYGLQCRRTTPPAVCLSWAWMDPELAMAKACDGEIKATPGDPCTPPECRAPL